MPILATSCGGDENDRYDVIMSPIVDNMTSSTGRGGPEVSTTNISDPDELDDGDSPRRRGPKKQPLTRARLAKVKVREIIT